MLEWIGGVLSPPFFVSDQEEPYRPDLAVWVEMPTGQVVAQEVLAPEDSEGGLARLLLATLEGSPSGPEHRPGRIRVGDESLAADVRAALGDAIPVVVAETPELDELLEYLVDSAAEPSQVESYLEGGRLEPQAVERLFVAAQRLYVAAPWKRATDDRVLRMDIPALDVDGACLSIIGSLGESLGFLLFPSLDGYLAFLDAIQEPPAEEEALLDFGTEWLSLSFERGADLPRQVRREAAAHAWPVANAAAYPWVGYHDADGFPRPLTPHDLEIVVACAEALCAFFARHGGLFEADDPEPVCESYVQDDDREVRLTLPYEALPFFDVESEPIPEVEPRRNVPKVGRNDPCPCGSGRKYKKCCLPLESKERAVARRREHRHERDLELGSQLVDDLMGFASERFGDAWRRFDEDFDEPTEALELAIPWSLYHFRVEGASVLEHYLEERGRRLSEREMEWLQAQRSAWLSVWEVTGVEPGKSLTLRDLLSDQERNVTERTASETLVLRDAVLARVVDHDEGAVLDSLYPYALPPLLAAEVVRRARGRLRRKRAVPVERLRDEGFGRYLIRRWEEAVEELEESPALPQRLENTDGDPLLFTTDHFDVEPGKASEVAARLAAIEGVEPPDEDEHEENEHGDEIGEPAYVFLREGNLRQKGWEQTVVGLARLSESTLDLETNSRRRAGDLRERVEAACGELIRHRAREHADPLSEKSLLADIGRARPESPREPPSEAQAQRVLELKQQHYAGWPDQEIPALDGVTPREAARTRKGRASLDLLLKDMEHREQRVANGTAFDFSEIRRQLGMD